MKMESQNHSGPAGSVSILMGAIRNPRHRTPYHGEPRVAQGGGAIGTCGDEHL
jgi:hypothetical protein